MEDKITLTLNENGMSTEHIFTEREVLAKYYMAKSFLDEIVTDDYSFSSWLEWTNQWVDTRKVLAYEFWKVYGKYKNEI